MKAFEHEVFVSKSCNVFPPLMNALNFQSDMDKPEHWIKNAI